MNKHFDPTGYLVDAAENLPSNRDYLAHINATAIDPTLIRLASNEMPYPPSPAVEAATRKAGLEGNLYPAPINPLRTQLAEKHHVHHDSILIGAGATELIDGWLRTFVGPDREGIFNSPHWAMYTLRMRILGATMVDVPLIADGNGFHYPLQATLDAISDRTRAIVVTSPNNPTGNRIEADVVEALCRTGLPVLLDYAYCDFEPAGSPDLTELIHQHPNLVVAMTFSKSYCLAGLRLGYMIGSETVIDYVDRFVVPGSSVSLASILAGQAALGDPGYKDSQVAKIISERERMITAVRAAGFKVFDSHANFFAIDAGDYPGGPTQITADLLARGVVIRVMSGVARVSVGAPNENDALIAAIQDMTSG
jgi:histidinol-phosphate aminotransferase